MFEDINKELEKYSILGETVALAQVVWRKAPTSGKPGDKALITKEGKIIGWIGGGCVRSIAVKEAINSIKEGKYRLVKIAPDLTEEIGPDNSVKTYKMSCQGGGSMELFIEPIMPKPHLVLIGKSNITRALAKISKAVGHRVTVLGKESDKEMFPEADKVLNTIGFNEINITPNTFIVVATQGDNDEEAVKNALQSKCNYVAFVASPKKSKYIKDYLFMNGVLPKLIDTLRTPAGIDINAKLPEEVAISILADVIKIFRSEKVSEVEDIEEPPSELSEDYFLNPVCNLPISKTDAKHIIDYKGHKVYFCCDGCKVSFDKTPDHYIEEIEKTAEKG